jgi:hypothetical protein
MDLVIMLLTVGYSVKVEGLRLIGLTVILDDRQIWEACQDLWPPSSRGGHF